MKKILLAIYISIGSFNVFGQFIDAQELLRSGTDASDTIIGWKIGGLLGINVSQSTFKDWAQGGINSIAFNGLTSITSHRKGKKSSLDITLDFAYDLQRLGKEKEFIKIDDKIEVSAKYGRKIAKYWNYAAFANIRTQVSPGYEYPEDSIKSSDFFSPAYVIGALGIDFRPDIGFSAFAAPLTSKFTFVNSTLLADQGAYGVDPAEFDSLDNMIKPGKNIRHEVGGYVRLVYKRHINKTKTILVLSKIDIFSNYLLKPENVDLNFELIINFKITKYISATISTQLIYDDDIKINIDSDGDGVNDHKGPRLQVKEVLGIGFSFKL